MIPKPGKDDYHESVGDWIESLLGTSAGTRLGSLLFIAFMYDVPKSIFPKFADIVAIL